MKELNKKLDQLKNELNITQNYMDDKNNEIVAYQIDNDYDGALEAEIEYDYLLAYKRELKKKIEIIEEAIEIIKK